MKFNFDLILPYRPRNKCGAETAIGGAILGASSLGSSIFNADSQSRTNRQQMNFTREENQKNRDFQSAEADKARVWQAQEWSRQFQAQASQWYQQLAAQQRAQQQNFQFEADYNSPRNQISRLADAGINPSAVMGGQGSSGLVSAASGNIGAAPSPSAPSGGNVAAPMPSGSAAGVNLQAPQIDLGGIGTFFAQMSRAYQENEKLRPEIDNVIASTQNLLADKYTKELLQTAQIMQNDILSQTKDAQIHQFWENLTSTYLDQKLKLLQGENIEADTAFKLADKFLTECKSKLSWEQYLQAAFTTSHMLETWTNEQNVIKSQTGLNVSGAAVNYALADKYLTEVNDINQRLAVFMIGAPYDYARKKKEYQILKWQMPGLIEKVYYDNKISEAQYKEIMHKIKNMDQDTFEKVFRNIDKSKMIDARTSPINWLLQYLGGETLARLFASGAI